MKTIKNEDGYDAYVIEYLQTPFMWDFFHKKVNKKKFLEEEEWHSDNIYFQFVPLDFDFDAWHEVIRKSSPAHDFAYNLGRREKEGSWFFVEGKKRYFVGKAYTRDELGAFADNEYFQSSLKVYPEFNRFCITKKGGNNYAVPMYDEDECVLPTGKAELRYRQWYREVYGKPSPEERAEEEAKKGSAISSRKKVTKKTGKKKTTRRKKGKINEC